jgi:hypothetical protein
LLGFAEAAGWSVGEAGEHPHATERDSSAEAGGWFGDKTSATGPEDAKYLTDHRLAVGDDEEQARDDDGIDVAEVGWQRVRVTATKVTVEKAAAGGATFRTKQKVFGEVDAGGLKLGILVGETTGVEPRAAADFEYMSAGSGTARGKQRPRDLRGVIAEEILATQSVEPPTSFEEALCRPDKGIAGQLAVV